MKSFEIVQVVEIVEIVEIVERLKRQMTVRRKEADFGELENRISVDYSRRLIYTIG